MKFLNFAKVKKATRQFFNSLAFWNKKKYAEKSAEIKRISEETSEMYKNRVGGHKYYIHMLVPLNPKFNVIYKNFTKQKLPMAIIVEGKKIYRIRLNPHFIYLNS